ncbi:MAG: DUF2237 domain-containing protein [Wenzhouxiangellaceae bacterium]|nr:DUF2237 domain-containing protein [Wenzhouxiangellaceae bacterium]MBS3747832.1 DUF2237 domain-containing protein [Wenzhouxiangellaceae bacterium]MBS3824493.1 DUF2237 domain-containing protein [Wenzhouxiangellaceae bacterium]
MMPDDPINVLGGRLETCSNEPLTGFYRDGCCNTADEDVGCHTVCAVLTDEFLEFSRARGNDLTAANPAFGFPGLKAGDRWCLCASRWLEAYRAGCAPRVDLEATHRRTLETVPLAALESHARGAEH